MKNKDLYTLSIIFPLLDASEDVEPVFKSVAKQIKIKKSSIEIIVIDDGSKDDTVSVVENSKKLFDKFGNFSIIIHKNRKGLPATRLDGVKIARGKYITFVDKKVRPDSDYLYQFLNKNRNFVIGNVYINKYRNAWGRVLSLVRKKLYYPYFNHEFEDIVLDTEGYRAFKNKGGGGAMFILRDYYLDVAEGQSLSMHSNDDTRLIMDLTKKEPLLKTASAKSEYLNREGFWENIIHLYNRGPKFIDFYIKPGSRFFPLIMALALVFVLNLVFAFFYPQLILIELAFSIIIDILVSIWLSEEFSDFQYLFILFPIAITIFSLGVFKGLFMKLFRLY
ncbi:MAG: glycosyltransferase [bacterium]|nr:glycosyltransferase [bacterium]